MGNIFRNGMTHQNTLCKIDCRRCGGYGQISDTCNKCVNNYQDNICYNCNNTGIIVLVCDKCFGSGICEVSYNSNEKQFDKII